MSTKNILLLLIGVVVIAGLGFAGFATGQKAKVEDSNIATKSPKSRLQILTLPPLLALV
jgi:hypothetical protein